MGEVVFTGVAATVTVGAALLDTEVGLTVAAGALETGISVVVVALEVPLPND
ncbi:MAG: hypothetical protein IPL34_07345 [Thiofilum sp.]|uniref:hypothetical protein n=1 Tax=Thiofilum sp. TaxID=2212733 RepID=UPI0029EE76EE|nr:hypothetical protein [Thiofilum sp.]